MSASLVGSITLNISFVLYLILYLPQIIHNRKSSNLSQLSLSLHLLLFSSYLFDLCYGFSRHLPWQYKTVSVIGLALICVQHSQLTFFFLKNKHIASARISTAFLLLTAFGLLYFFNQPSAYFSPAMIAMFGVIARVSGLLYSLPQIIKNQRLKSANALSFQFLCINLSIALLDTISSWSLDWGWPNKLGSPITILLMLIMLGQIKKYNHDPKSLNGVSSLASST